MKQNRQERLSSDSLISIIIPVFNGGKYLEECLNSVETQSYANLEIIVLDDGSADETPGICERHAASDSRIRYERFEETKGQGARRNYGMETAKGVCIGFMDSDDIAHRDMYSILYGHLADNDAQIAVCRLQVTPVFSKPGQEQIKIMTGEEAVKCFLTDPEFGAFSCNKLFRREILCETGKYPEGMFYEDVVYIPQVCGNAQKLVRTARSLYYYRQHDVSVTRSPFSRKKLDQVKAYEMLVPALLKQHPALEPFLYEKAFSAMMELFKNMTEAQIQSDTIEKNLLEHAQKYRKNFSMIHSSNKKRMLVLTAVCMFPAICKKMIRFLNRTF